MKIRHTLRSELQPRGITPRRLAASRRALKREQEELALFAGEVAAEQESPAERIEQIDADLATQDQGHRNLAARHWRWGRAVLREVSSEVRRDILDKWNRSFIPPFPHYFADFVRRELLRRGILEPDDGA